VAIRPSGTTVMTAPRDDQTAWPTTANRFRTVAVAHLPDARDLPKFYGDHREEEAQTGGSHATAARLSKPGGPLWFNSVWRSAGGHPNPGVRRGKLFTVSVRTVTQQLKAVGPTSAGCSCCQPSRC